MQRKYGKVWTLKRERQLYRGILKPNKTNFIAQNELSDDDGCHSFKYTIHCFDLGSIQRHNVFKGFFSNCIN